MKHGIWIPSPNFGGDHDACDLSILGISTSFGQSLYGQGDYREAVAKFQRANALKPEDAVILSWFGLSLHDAGKYVEAEPLYRRALAIFESALGPEHPDVATVLENYAILLRKLNREEEAAKLAARAKEIRAKAR